MGASVAGRRPKPAEVKRAAGNPGKRKLPPPDPSPVLEVASPPSWLSDGARRSWLELAPELVAKRILARSDLAAFAALCVVHARWRDAEEKLTASGIMVKASARSRARMPSPWLAIANRAFDQYRKLVVEFGSTPAARSRVAGTPERKHNHFERFRSKAPDPPPEKRTQRGRKK